MLNILKSYNISELTSGIAHVCHRWRSACCDPSLWKTIDLSELRSENPIYPAEEDVRKLTKILKISLSLSHGSTDKLIFPFIVTLQDGLFIHAAERTTNLKRLVLPSWKRIELSEAVMCRAFRGWQELESLSMPCTLLKRNILKEISSHCNIRELKIVTFVSFDRDKAELLAEFLPKLKGGGPWGTNIRLCEMLSTSKSLKLSMMKIRTSSSSIVRQMLVEE